MSNNNIALTASMRSNLLSLQNTQSLMNKTQDRLSTGYKVNSAMDNPSSYFTAQALNSRANDLSSLLDSIGQAISTLEVADEGITTLQDFVEQAKSIANSARDTSNVSASSTSTVKFNTDTLRSDLVTNQVNGLTPGNSSMTIRLGDATKLDGLTNVSEETALSNLGIGTTGASDIGTLSIDGKAYTIDASGSTKQMTNVSSYGSESVLKITDGSDLTKAKVEDAAGNKYTLDLSGMTGIDADSKQIKVKTGAEGGIKATVAENGKTTWELTDKNAWTSPAEKIKTSTWAAGSMFEVDVTNGKLKDGVAGDDVTALANSSAGDITLQDGDIIMAADKYVVNAKADESDVYADQGLEASMTAAFDNALVSRDLTFSATPDIDIATNAPAANDTTTISFGSRLKIDTAAYDASSNTLTLVDTATSPKTFTVTFGDDSFDATFASVKAGDIIELKAALVVKNEGGSAWKAKDGTPEDIEAIKAAFKDAVMRTAKGATAGTDFSASSTFAAGTRFEVDSYDRSTNKLTLNDASSASTPNSLTITFEDDSFDDRFSVLRNGDIIEINDTLAVIDDGAGNYTSESYTAFKGALLVDANSMASANAVNRSSPAITADPVVTRPIEDLTGAARDIKGTYTYTVPAQSGATPGALTFKMSDVDTTAGTATLTDAEGNVFKNVKLGTLTSALSDSDTDITISNTTSSAISFSLSKAENDITVAVFDDNGSFDFAGATNTTGSVEATAKGTMVQANTVYIDNGGTVGDMAETLQNMIGNTRLSVSVEDSNLKLKTLDTSSLEVKDGSVLGTNGTANGVGFATAFGLDVGQTIKLDASDTAESLRQKVEQMSRNMRDGRSVTAEFDQNGHMVIKSSEGDDMVISGELADRLGVSGKSTNGSNERAIYSQQFNNVLTQIDQLVQDTSYKGINLLKGDNLTVNFNESRTSTIELKGVNFDATGLGFTQAVNEWRTNANIDKSLEQITKATSMLRAQASEFGQNLSTVQIREDFTKNMINNLQSGADKLTLADMNEEAANMLALQTRQQLGVNSLSLASQASQSVLKLF